jgi:hypothetical protein
MTLQALRDLITAIERGDELLGGPVLRRAKEALALTVPGETEIDGLIERLESAAVGWRLPDAHEGRDGATEAELLNEAADALRTLSSSRPLDGCKARNAVIEECAKVADEFDYDGLLDDELPKGWRGCRRLIAARIRALKEAKPVHASQGKDDTK